MSALTDEELQGVRDGGPGWCGAEVFDAILAELRDRRAAEAAARAGAEAAWYSTYLEAFADGRVEGYQSGRAAAQAEGARLREALARLVVELKRSVEDSYEARDTRLITQALWAWDSQMGYPPGEDAPALYQRLVDAESALASDSARGAVVRSNPDD